MKIGYARVSREEQSLERQISALQHEGCESIFSEKMGGVYKSRPELDKMLAIIVPGDIVIVQKLDRLGRDTINLLLLLKDLRERGIEFKSIQDSFDTSTPIGRFVMTIMGGFAELEREVIHERVMDGLKQARKEGKIL